MISKAEDFLSDSVNRLSVATSSGLDEKYVITRAPIRLSFVAKWFAKSRLSHLFADSSLFPRPNFPITLTWYFVVLIFEASDYRWPVATTESFALIYSTLKISSRCLHFIARNPSSTPIRAKDIAYRTIGCGESMAGVADWNGTSEHLFPYNE